MARGVENKVVTVFHLREEQPVLTACFFTFLFAEEWCERRQPFLADSQQILRGQRVRQFLEALRMAALQKEIGGLLEIDSLLAQAISQPVMLIEADTR